MHQKFHSWILDRQRHSVVDTKKFNKSSLPRHSDQLFCSLKPLLILISTSSHNLFHHVNGSYPSCESCLKVVDNFLLSLYFFETNRHSPRQAFDNFDKLSLHTIRTWAWIYADMKVFTSLCALICSSCYHLFCSFSFSFPFLTEN